MLDFERKGRMNEEKASASGKMKAKYIYSLGVLLFCALSIFLTFNRHSKGGYFNYHSEIWADKAGYYVYLPAAFEYGFDPANFPDSIDAKTGNGFALDLVNGKVLTKYTCGVALLQSPFYCLAGAFAKPLNFEKNGFSPIYHWSVNIASIFYLIFGLIFLKKFLTLCFDHKSALLAVGAIFLATNLYYYSIDETGMSHVYSFSLFCVFLYFIQSTKYLANTKLWKTFAFGLLAGLIVLLRPTNILFLSVFFFLNIESKNDILLRVKRVFHYKKMPLILLGVGLAILPQLLYWNYVSGSPVSYSYGDEGFNWLSPKFLNTYFSPNNGLFLYTPFYLFVLATLFLMIKDKKVNGVYVLALFLAISYTFSSWWDWSFGCCFGSRSYVEYLSVLSIPVAYGFQKMKGWSLSKNAIVTVALLLFVAFNLKMTYSYDGCYYNDNDWDWNAYWQLVLSPTK